MTWPTSGRFPTEVLAAYQEAQEDYQEAQMRGGTWQNEGQDGR